MNAVISALVLISALGCSASRVEVDTGQSVAMRGVRGAAPKQSVGLLSVIDEPHEDRQDAVEAGVHKDEEHEEHHEEHHNGNDEGDTTTPLGQHHEDHGEHGHGEKAAHGVAVLLLASVILLPSIFMLLTSENRLIRQNSLTLVDNFISIFLAVMWFQAFDEMFKVNGFSETHKFVGAILHVCVMMMLFQILAYLMRGKHIHLLVFTTIGAHYLSFSAIHASEHAQEHYFSSGIGMAFAFGPIVLCLLCGLMGLMYVIRMTLKWSEDEKLEEAVEDMEIDVCALTLAFILTQAVRFALVGQYPGDAGEAKEVNEGGHHLFIQKHHVESEMFLGYSESEVSHTALQRNIMLVYTFVCLIVAAVMPWEWIKSYVHGNKHLVRAVMITHHTTVMLGAWGFMLWGEWEFFETIFVGDTHECFGRIVFALLCTVVAIAVVVGMAMIGEDMCPYNISSVFGMALGLSCAWSWEHAFDVAVDSVAEAYHVLPGNDNDAKVLKAVTALVAPCFMIPPYLKYIKPQVLKEQEEIEEQEEKEVEEMVEANKKSQEKSEES